MKLKKQLMIKSQMMIFKQLYPDLIEKNQIKYPIDDRLIKKMPDLHGGSCIKQTPDLKSIIIEHEDFENLLYIWEFFNNFSDFFQIPVFDLAELQASLAFNDEPSQVQTHFEQDVESSQELSNDPLQGYDKNQRCTIEEIRENGFNLVNQIHLVLMRAICTDIEDKC